MCCFGRASQLSSTCLKENGSRSAINHSQKNLLRWFSFESLLEFWIIPLKNFSFREKKKKNRLHKEVLPFFHAFGLGAEWKY